MRHVPDGIGIAKGSDKMWHIYEIWDMEGGFDPHWEQTGFSWSRKEVAKRYAESIAQLVGIRDYNCKIWGQE